MRGRSGGLWLPALVLTALAVLGVVVLLAAGAPVVPRSLPDFLVRDEAPGTRSVDVPASRSHSPTPRATPPTTVPARPTSVPTIGPTRRPPATKPGKPVKPVKPVPPRPSSPAAKPSATRPPAPRCTAGSVTVQAVADSYVDQESPARNFGSTPNLLVASRDRDRNRRALVRFPMPAIPAGCALRTATLTLNAKDVTGRRLLVNRAGKAWSETGVTWANAPAPAGSSASATVDAATVSWSVTSLVAAMRAGGNYGFVVRDASENARGGGEQTNLSARTSNAAPALFVRWS